jgi:SAM-dependent methyltransferase
MYENSWSVAGYSIPAGEVVHFHVDMLAGGYKKDGIYIPNVREQLVCPITGMNNRQRLVATIASAQLDDTQERRDVYITEQLTALYNWFSRTKGNTHNIIGSEYLRENLRSGEIVNGTRHEDVCSLSFEFSTIDMVISNDVLEHVSTPSAAIGELARVIRPGGQALMTFPFFSDRESSVTRAEVVNGNIVHHCDPIYHVNPISNEGSLVFSEFGWDLFDLIYNEGFSDVALEVYHSVALGHLGIGLLVFRLTR